MDNSRLEELRDKCHMIIEAVEDECKTKGACAVMASMYSDMKFHYKDLFGQDALKVLVESMDESMPTITYPEGDEEDGDDEEEPKVSPVHEWHQWEEQQDEEKSEHWAVCPGLRKHYQCEEQKK